MDCRALGTIICFPNKESNNCFAIRYKQDYWEISLLKAVRMDLSSHYQSTEHQVRLSRGLRSMTNSVAAGLIVSLAGFSSYAEAVPFTPSAQLTGVQVQQQYPYSAPFYPMLKAGDRNGSPIDTHVDRIDPNVSTSPYGGVGSFDIRRPSDNSLFLSTGTLITPRHVLGAAHTFDLDGDGNWQDDLVNANNATFNLNFTGSRSTSVTAQNIHFHPQFDGYNFNIHDDLAIVELSTPINTIRGENSGNRIPTYDIDRNLIVSGTEVTLAGYGQSGAGNISFYPILGVNDTKRTGKNVIDTFTFSDFDGPGGSFSSEIWFYDFDGPTSATNVTGGLTLGNDIETHIGAGDSGGPAFVGPESDLKLAATMTFRQGNGAFGAQGGGVALHPYLSWIDSVVPGLTENSAISGTPITQDVTQYNDSLSGLWYTSPNSSSTEFEFSITAPNGGQFAEISEFAQDGIEVIINGISYGLFNQGDSFSFMDLFGDFGISEFVLISTNPLAANSAFVQLEFSEGEIDFSIDTDFVIIPTPTTSLPMFLFMLASLRRRRRDYLVH